LQVDRSKHISVSGEDNCMCTFQIRWLAGPNVEQTVQVHCENIFLLRFGRIESHRVLKEAAKFLEDRKYNDFQNINNFQNINKDVRDRIVIVEDENGYLVCSIQKHK